MNATDKKIYQVIKELNVTSLDDIFRVKKLEEVLEEHHELSENDGFIEVRDNQLFVIDPKDGGKFPILIHNPNLAIFVNGKKMVRDTVVSSKDKIEVFKDRNEKLYSITVSKDKMEIFLQVNKELFCKYALKDQRRANKIMLEMESKMSPCNVEEVSIEIAKDILKKGINVEIDSTAIIQELIHPTFHRIKVAEGLPPIPPVDSFLETYFPTNVEEVFEEVKGQVNFKNRLKIPTVSPGELIAKLYPPKEGKKGYNVYGEILNPRSPKKIILKPKPRVRVIEDGSIIALQQGRPTISGQSVKTIDVLTAYEVNGDVDMSTGNIYFNGDVIIYGNVQDNMKVESLGNVYVLGNVYSALVSAAQDVKIRGTVINSNVIAGQLSMFYSQIYKKAQDLSSSFKRLIKAMNQLRTTMEQKGMPFDFSHIFQTLFEMKFSNIYNEVKEIEQIYHSMPKSEHDVKFRILINVLSKFKNYYTLREINSMQTLVSVLFSLNEIIDEFDSMIKGDCCIHVRSADLSTLKTNGSIIINGEGVVKSHLFAGKDIIFKNKMSAIRSGKLEALKNIYAGIVGTVTGEAPVLYAGEMMKMEEIHQAHLKMPHFGKFIDLYHGKTTLIFNPNNEEVTIH